jgi:hypothetical protein
MRRVRPDEVFLGTLVVAGLSDEEIGRIAEMDGTVSVRPDELTRIRGGLLGAPSRFHVGSAQAMVWLREHGLYDLYVGTPAGVQAVELARDPVRRRVVEALILGGHDDWAVTGSLGRSKLEATAPVVAAFRNGFWNLDWMAQQDLLAFVGRHPLRAWYVTATDGPDQALVVAEELSPRRPKPTRRVSDSDPGDMVRKQSFDKLMERAARDLGLGMAPGPSGNLAMTGVADLGSVNPGMAGVFGSVPEGGAK